MAPAADNDSTDPEIWLRDALALLTDDCGGDFEFAKGRLVTKLVENGMPWSHVDEDGQRVKGDAAWFSHKRDPLEIDLATNSAFYAALVEGRSDAPGGRKRGIKVSRSAVYAMLSNPPESQPEPEPETAPAFTEQVASPPAASEEAPTSAAEQYDDRPQIKRAIQSLRSRIFPPDGKVPVGMTVETVRGKIDADLADENRNLGKATPGWDIVKEAIEILGRRGD